MTNSDPLYLRVMDRRRRGPAEHGYLRPVNPRVRTNPGTPPNFRLSANNGREGRSKSEGLARRSKLRKLCREHRWSSRLKPIFNDGRNVIRCSNGL